MSYVEKTLQPGETIIYRTRLHWIVFFPSIVLFVAGLVAIILGPRAQEEMVAKLVGTLGYAMIIFAFVMAISVWVQFISTEMAITNRRVVAKVGFIWRRTIEMERQKVESAHGSPSLALRAGPPSPLLPISPVPAKVFTIPLARVTLRTTEL